MPDTKRVDSPDLGAMQQVAKVARLLSANLFSVKAEQGPATAPMTAPQFNRGDVLWRVENLQPNKRLWVRVKFSAKGIGQKTQSAAAAFDISAEYELVYDFSPSDWLTNENLATFAMFNGTFNAWPFWREVVLSTTSKMGFRDVIVPLLVI